MDTGDGSGSLAHGDAAIMPIRCLGSNDKQGAAVRAKPAGSPFPPDMYGDLQCSNWRITLQHG